MSSQAPVKLNPADLTKAMFLREVKKTGGGTAKVEDSGKVDAHLATALTQRSIKTQGVIAVPAGAAPVDLTMATALTQVALAKSGGRAVSLEKSAKLDASKVIAHLIMRFSCVGDKFFLFSRPVPSLSWL